MRLTRLSPLPILAGERRQQMNTGWILGIGGAVIGLMGGIIGTYFSIKNTRGPRERAFMLKSSVVCWLGITVFLGLLFTLPSPHRHFLWMPYVVLLPLGIIHSNRTQQRIRKEESQNAVKQPPQ